MDIAFGPPMLAAAAARSTPTVGEWIGAALALVISISVALGLRWAIRRVSHRRDTVTSTVQIMGHLVFAVVIAIGIYIGLRIIGVDLAPVLAGAGIVGIAVAFALKDIAKNYISGILMGFRNPFNTGDQIVSGEHEGTVEELNLRYTTIRTYEGVRVLLPNGQVLASPLTNLTVNGNRRTDFTIGVDYDTDLDEARHMAITAVDQVPGLDTARETEAWVEELNDSWITIRIRYWHGPRIADVWETRSAAITAVMAAAKRHNIELPYERNVIEIIDHTTGGAVQRGGGAPRRESRRREP